MTWTPETRWPAGEVAEAGRCAVNPTVGLTDNSYLCAIGPLSVLADGKIRDRLGDSRGGTPVPHSPALARHHGTEFSSLFAIDSRTIGSMTSELGRSVCKCWDMELVCSKQQHKRIRSTVSTDQHRSTKEAGELPCVYLTDPWKVEKAENWEKVENVCAERRCSWSLGYEARRQVFFVRFRYRQGRQGISSSGTIGLLAGREPVVPGHRLFLQVQWGTPARGQRQHARERGRRWH